MPAAAQQHPSQTRVIAALLLKEIIAGNRSLAQTTTLSDELDARDKAFVQALCYGCCRQYIALKACIDQLLKKPLKEKDYDLLALMIIGCYQLNYMRLPPHAAISSCVDASRLLGKGWASKMINAILRNYQRRSSQLVEALSPWQRDAHPKWLTHTITQDWPQHYQSIIANNNQQAPMCLRIAPRHSRQQYQQALLERNIDSEACHYSPRGIRLKSACNIDALIDFDIGAVSVQDEAAQLATLILNPQHNDYVLDACAAPGGKACHLLEHADIELLAVESDALRGERIKENLNRLNLNAAVHIADATDVDNWWDQRPFDQILIDAPCSGTGVIRRHPDIKLLRRESDIKAMTALQAQLLDNLWPTLRPGGRLLYATCSILRVENDRQIERFFQRTKDAKNIIIDQPWGISTAYGRQLLPEHNGPDGFYYALIEKKQAG